MSKVLVIGDIHAPVTHPAYLTFCTDLKYEWDCDQVVFIGDIVDWHGVSFHASHPEAPGPSEEYELALRCVQRWYRHFPDARVCIGNHDERLNRLAESTNIPSKFLRDYADIWQTPGWDWAFEHTLDDVYYFHGTGNGGMHPAFNVMKKMAMSVVMGHIHSAGGTRMMANPNQRFHCMDTGCGVDDKGYAFAYGKHTKVRSVLSAGVVIDGIPYHVPMRCGRGEKYDRFKFIKKAKKGANYANMIATTPYDNVKSRIPTS